MTREKQWQTASVTGYFHLVTREKQWQTVAVTGYCHLVTREKQWQTVAVTGYCHLVTGEKQWQTAGYRWQTHLGVVRILLLHHREFYTSSQKLLWNHRKVVIYSKNNCYIITRKLLHTHIIVCCTIRDKLLFNHRIVAVYQSCYEITKTCYIITEKLHNYTDVVTITK